ncbi:MAG: hypothetical protein K2I53_12875 [Lachnospiraceae bacterium]|nr:hypothetical protein [Lachnospiraceae bacterium]
MPTNGMADFYRAKARHEQADAKRQIANGHGIAGHTVSGHGEASRIVWVAVQSKN